MPTSPPTIPRPHPWLKPLWLLLLTLLTTAILCTGLELRRWTWTQTQPIRFTDVNRNYRFGRRAVTEGYLDLYDKVLAETRDTYMDLDYAPLRLLVMKWWVHSLPIPKDNLPPRWQPQDWFNASLCQFNAAMELIACAGIFFLTRHWLLRPSTFPSSSSNTFLSPSSPPTGPPASSYSWQAPSTWKHYTLPLLAVCFFWFNPAVLINAYGWPTWDVWVIAFYVWVLYFASKNHWWTSGFLLGFGALFKGQNLIVAPFFILVPLFMKKPAYALRWTLGLAFSIALLTSIWMLRLPPNTSALQTLASLETAWRQTHQGILTPQFWTSHPNLPSLHPNTTSTLNLPALYWTLSLLSAFLLSCLHHYLPTSTKPLSRWLPLTALILLLWQTFHLPPNPLTPNTFLKILLPILLISLTRFLPKQQHLYALSGLIAFALFSCIPLFNASTGWLQVGWAYGTKHWEWLVMGNPNNLPALLAHRFGWNNKQDLLYIITTIPARQFLLWPTHDLPITTKTLLNTLYFTLLTLCSFGAARHLRANDKRFLVAAIAPWLMMFCFLGQMHNRYLIYTVAIGACLLAINFGFFLLLSFMSLVTTLMTLHVMLPRPAYIPDNWSPQPYHLITQPTIRQWLHWINSTHPDLAWAILTIAAIFLYISLQPPTTWPPLPPPPRFQPHQPPLTNPCDDKSK